MRVSNSLVKTLTRLMMCLGLLVGSSQLALADYSNALNGVGQVKAIFDVSQGSAKVSNLVFWAVENVYKDSTVNKLGKPPMTAVVFHGKAVKLLSTDPKNHENQDLAEVAKFHEKLRAMKKDGVKVEVCEYALKVLKVDPATVIPEVDRVGNGFVSIVGYQAQGYQVVRIP